MKAEWKKNTRCDMKKKNTCVIYGWLFDMVRRMWNIRNRLLCKRHGRHCVMDCNEVYSDSVTVSLHYIFSWIEQCDAYNRIKEDNKRTMEMTLQYSAIS